MTQRTPPPRGPLGPGGRAGGPLHWGQMRTRFGLAVVALGWLPLSASAAPALEGRLDRIFDQARIRKPLEISAGTVKWFESPARQPAFSPLPYSGSLKATRAMVVVPDPVPTKPFKRLFARLIKETGKTDRYDDYLLIEARKRGLDPRLLKAIMAAESEFNPKALSPKGAVGLMQILPTTAESMGVPRSLIKDPWQNIKAGATYIAHLYDIIAKRHNMKGVRMADAPVWMVQRVIASYHAGPKFLSRGSWYKSTRLYVRKVLLFYQSRVTDVRRDTAASLPAEATFGPLL